MSIFDTIGQVPKRRQENKKGAFCNLYDFYLHMDLALLLFASEQVMLMKYLTVFHGKTIDTASMVLCLLATKTSPTAVPSLLTSLLVVDGMKIVGS